MLTTLKTLPSEHTERYIKKVNKYLKLDYDYFIDECKKNGIAIHRDFLPENGGFEKFEKKAFELDYKLGLKPCLQDGENIVHFSTITFKTKVISLRGKKLLHFSNGKKSFWYPFKNTDGISGFGITLNLLGWNRFSGIKVVELDKRLKAGEQIDSIFTPKTGSSASGRIIEVNGERMTTSAACEKCGINRTAFQNRVRGIKDDSMRQSVFNKMRSKAEEEAKNPRPDFDEKRSMIKVEKDDLYTILAFSKRYNLSIPTIVKRLVSLGKREVEKAEAEKGKKIE